MSEAATATVTAPAAGTTTAGGASGSVTLPSGGTGSGGAGGTGTIPVETKVVPAAAAPAKERVSIAGEPAKPAEVAKPVDLSMVAAVPLDYSKLALKDVEVDAAMKDGVVKFATENKLPVEVAQKMLERDHAAAQEYVKSNSFGGTNWTKRVDSYEAEALADQEIGGTPEKLKANAELGRRVLEKYFPPEVKEYLIQSGLGSNKHVMKGFLKLAKMSGEDRVVIAGAQGGASAAPGGLEDMYK